MVPPLVVKGKSEGVRGAKDRKALCLHDIIIINEFHSRKSFRSDVITRTEKLRLYSD